MKNEESYIEANKKLWNSRVEAHLHADFYNMHAFRQTRNSLNQIELELLGDVRNKTILHLQCHFGQDTLSLAHLGAMVTGIDFSEQAVQTARELNNEFGLHANFICCNVYDVPDFVKDEFDIVYTSYGTIGWLPDLKRWAAVIEKCLKPGGRFVMVDFHPFIWMMDETYSELKYAYTSDEVIHTVAQGSYAAVRNDSPLDEYGWNHSLSDIITALTAHQLQLLHFREHDGSPYSCFPDMVKDNDDLWRFKKWGRKIPYLYSLVFRKPL